MVDVNDRSNVAGAGIDLAQRVMDCGDAGHILLSKRVADDLVPYPRWHPYLYEIGAYEIKHGRQIHLVNFFTGEIGNPKIFKKKKKKKKKGRRRRLPALPTPSRSFPWRIFPANRLRNISPTA